MKHSPIPQALTRPETALAPPRVRHEDKELSTAGGGAGGNPFATVLDACCGSRMFWFNRTDPRAIFVDKRREQHELTDSSSKGGSRMLIVDPDLQADFTSLPFFDGQFAMVVFDPPHLVKNGRTGWLAKKYGKLGPEWQDELRMGFAECFRVLKPEGTLVFKWNEQDIPASKVLALTPEKPLFGNRCGKSGKTHWMVFLKTAQQTSREGEE